MTFDLSEVSVLGDLAANSYELDGGRAEKLSGSVSVVLLTAASAEFFFAKKIQEGGLLGVVSSHNRDSGLDWRSAGVGVKRIRAL